MSPESVNSKQQIIKNWFSDVSSVSSRISGLDVLTRNGIINSDFHVSHDEGLKHPLFSKRDKEAAVRWLNRILCRAPGGTDIHS